MNGVRSLEAGQVGLPIGSVLGCGKGLASEGTAKQAAAPRIERIMSLF